jgi:hypothetical protein
MPRKKYIFSLPLNFIVKTSFELMSVSSDNHKLKYGVKWGFEMTGIVSPGLCLLLHFAVVCARDEDYIPESFTEN